MRNIWEQEWEQEYMRYCKTFTFYITVYRNKIFIYYKERNTLEKLFLLHTYYIYKYIPLPNFLLHCMYIKDNVYKRLFKRMMQYPRLTQHAYWLQV